MTIKNALKEKEELEERLKKIKTFINSAQEVCEHENKKYIGNDHKDYIYECIECKKWLRE